MRKIGALILSLGFAAGAFALDEHKVAKDPVLEEAMKQAEPTDTHKMLGDYAGTWSCKMRSRTAPGEEFQFSMGTSEIVLTMGNRFLKQTLHGDWAGVSFQGEGLIGYDVIRGEYQWVWADSTNTGMMGGVGTYDAANKTLKFVGDYSSPLTGEKARWFRSEWRVISPESTVYTVFNQGPDGKEFQAMEITYTRVP